MFRAFFLLVSALGCSSSSISGDLEGATPSIVEAVFVESDQEGAEDLLVLVADFEGVCSRLREHQSAVSVAQSMLLTAESDEAFLAGAQAMEAADALLPENFWLGRLALHRGSMGDSFVGAGLSGAAANAEVIEGFRVSFAHHRGYTDWVACSEAWLSNPGGVDVCDYQWESWISHGGEARVLEYVAASDVGVEFSAPFRAMDVSTSEVLDEVGVLEGRIWAQWCGDLQIGG